MNPPTLTIQKAVERYLELKVKSRCEATGNTYKFALRRFCDVLAMHDIPPTLPADTIQEQAIAWLLDDTKDLAIATEKLYTAAVVDFLTFLEGDEIKKFNMSKVRQLVRQRGRRPPERLYSYNTDHVEALIAGADKLAYEQAENQTDELINLRDRALIVTLADTGLRIHEACGLKRGDIDINTGQAVIIGKGNKQAVVRFSTRSLKAIKDYLSLRTGQMDGKSGRPLSSLPLFSRHDRGAGGKVKPMTTVTGRNIVKRRLIECLGTDHIGEITPHTLRHRFVTNVLRSSGNLKLAKDLARHANIGITQRYAHLTNDELDDGYRKAFEN